MSHAEYLRSQAARCLRAAMRCPDEEFAQALLKVAQELRTEADEIEVSADGEPAFGTATEIAQPPHRPALQPA